jgi:hypothetical protein
MRIFVAGHRPLTRGGTVDHDCKQSNDVRRRPRTKDAIHHTARAFRLIVVWLIVELTAQGDDVPISHRH